jgi:predicted TIM-barrel fold metal-dependent hydrolase
MLRGARTPIERARFPVIDIHTHLCWAEEQVSGIEMSGSRRYLATPADLLPVMDRMNVRALVNLTGGWGTGLGESVTQFDIAEPSRFYTFTTPDFGRVLEPDYSRSQADAVVDAHRAGARGLKILKTLGLFLREGITTGPLIGVDDARFDPMWDVCGQLRIPAAIHVSDPAAFFRPVDRFNERYEELSAHPDWSFHGGDFPSKAQLLAARDRVFARHPNTQFLALHVGNFAEDLEHVSGCLDRFPNVSVDIAARIGELGRQPRAARKFFDRYQDRVLFGTDATPQGYDMPQQLFGEQLYEIYFRFLETPDEYFDYAPCDIPPQGRWRIYGLELPEDILIKVYNHNAVRLLGENTQT